MADQSASMPEQSFFADPAMDRILAVTLALASEVWVLRDRVAGLEARLADAGALDLDSLNAEPSDAERAERAADRKEFVAHLMAGLSGLQQSRGAGS